MDEWKKSRLLFCVEETLTEVVLLRNEKEIGRMRIESNLELLERLLPAIDGLLEEHSLVPSDVLDICVESGLPDGYSSRRIAETVANMWNRVWIESGK